MLRSATISVVCIYLALISLGEEVPLKAVCCIFVESLGSSLLATISRIQVIRIGRARSRVGRPRPSVHINILLPHLHDLPGLLIHSRLKCELCLGHLMLHLESVQVFILRLLHLIDPLVYWHLAVECTGMSHLGIPWKYLVIVELRLEAALFHLFDFKVLLQLFSVFSSLMDFGVESILDGLPVRTTAMLTAGAS